MSGDPRAHGGKNGVFRFSAGPVRIPPQEGTVQYNIVLPETLPFILGLHKA